MSEHLRQQWRTASSGIEGYLQAVSQMQRMVNQTQKEGWKFHSMEELILHYGKPYTPGALSEDLCRGEMGLCYMNAARAAMDFGLTYVEGYGDPGFLPTGHAWLSADGHTAMDPTWEKVNGYFGVALSTSWLTSWTSRTGHWGVFFVDIPDDNWLSLLKDGLPPGALA